MKFFRDIDSALKPLTLLGYTFQKYDDHFVFYRLETNLLNIPEVIDRVDETSLLNIPEVMDQVNETSMLSCVTRVQLYLYPIGFVTEERGCRLKRGSMMQNVSNYIKLEGEQTFNILHELKELKFKKKKEYFRPMLLDIHFFKSYTSLQTYRLLMKEFQSPSLPLLKKITEGNLDAVKCTKS